MKQGWKIALASITGLGLGIWMYQCRPEEDSEKSDCHCGCQGEQNKPSFGDRLLQDNYIGNVIFPDSFPSNTKEGDTPKVPLKFGEHLRLRRGNKTDKSGSQSFDYQKALGNTYRTTQVSLFNPTAQELKVRLWADQQPIGPVLVSKPSLNLDPNQHVHVQALGWNPANQCIYLISQLSNRLTVINQGGEVTATLTLDNATYPGVNSPVDLAINTNKESPHYGFVYVIGSVANTLSIFDLNHVLIDTISCGVRPVSIVEQTADKSFYIANLGDHSISVLEADTHLISRVIPTPEKNPLSLTYCAEKADVYACYLQNSGLSLFSSDGLLKGHFDAALTEPKNIVYDRHKSEIWVIGENGNVIVVNCRSHENRKLSLTKVQSVSFDDSHLYTVSSDGSVRQLSRTLQTLKIYPLKAAYLVGNEQDWISFDHLNTQVHWISTQPQEIVFDKEYLEKQQDFKYNPALIKHVRFFTYGENEIISLRLIHKTVTGTSKVRTISLNDYRSPQHFQKVYELGGMEGSLLDNRTYWQLKVSAGQRITALIYYQQFEMYSLLPEHSRKAIPII